MSYEFTRKKISDDRRRRIGLAARVLAGFAFGTGLAGLLVGFDGPIDAFISLAAGVVMGTGVFLAYSE